MEFPIDGSMEVPADGGLKIEPDRFSGQDRFQGSMRSIRGRQWDIQKPDQAIQRDIEAYGLDRPLAEILSSRGLGIADLDGFLNPLLRNTLPDPFIFKDMEKGVIHIADDMEAKRTITIWSDYDCDGVTSASILKLFFRTIGFGEVGVRIPDRINEGYGPNANGLRDLKENGTDTVCILDSGIVAFEALEAAREVDLKAIIIDHHPAEEKLPPAVAVINANRLDEKPGYGHLCAAGMVFEFCVGMAKELNRRGWFDGRNGRPDGIPHNEMMELLNIVALGTVADVVPLTTLNRAYVTAGLNQFLKRKNPGLCALATVCGLKPEDRITAMDLGWKMGPRINAGGRIDNAMIGVDLLTTTNWDEAVQLARHLDNINSRRKSIETQVTEIAVKQFQGRVSGIDRKIAIAVVEDGHEGVVGISAGRLREAYDCPAIVLARDKDGNFKGSGRSVEGFDLGGAIIEARNTGMITKGGGHPMAAGVSLTPDQLEPFEAFMNAKIEKSDYFRTGVITNIDVVLQPHELTVDLIDGFMRMEPFGQSNPQPRVMLEGAEIRDIKIMGEKKNHMKALIGNGSGTLNALIWNSVDTPLGDFITDALHTRIDLCGEVGINNWLGNSSAQIIVEDARKYGGTLI